MNDEQKNLMQRFLQGTLGEDEQATAVGLLRREPEARLFVQSAIRTGEFENAQLHDENYVADVLEICPTVLVERKMAFLGQKYSRQQIVEFFVGGLVGLLLIVILLVAYFWE